MVAVFMLMKIGHWQRVEATSVSIRLALARTGPIAAELARDMFIMGDMPRGVRHGLRNK